MARIRSIHPGFATDESMVSVSMQARLFLVLLWGECWDDGVFEWKPVGLKMKLLPVDNVDVAGLLSELEGAGIVRRFASNGKTFGAVRNFRKFQKPKKPNRSNVLPLELNTYVGAEADAAQRDPDGGTSVEPASPHAGTVPNQFRTSVEPVQNRYRTSSEPVPLGEGEGEGEGRRGNLPAAQPSPARVHVHEAATCRDFDQLEAALRGAAGLVNDPSPSLCNLGPIVGLIDAGFSLEWDILPVLRAKAAAGKRGRSWAFYVEAIREAKAGRSAAAQHPPDQRGVTEAEWRARCDRWFSARHWPSPFGPDPDMAGCEAPKPIIEAARAAARQREFA